MDAIIAVLPNPVEMREDALMAACKSDQGKCGMEPGVEAGFAARVLHTTVDSFGSLSVLRVIANSREEGKEGEFHSLPHEAVNLRTGNKFKMPSASTSFGLCGKERLSLADGARVIPGDVIAVPKLPEDIRTNDILTIPGAVKEEESEIDIETITNVLTPLSRPIEDIPLMAAATVSMSDIAGKKAKGRSTGADDKLISALAAMAREDLALRVEHDAVSAKLLLRCMSGDHLQLVASRLKDRFGLEVELGQPRVQYRETLIKIVTNVEGKHKKQSGGSGQFGVCFIGMEPLEEGAGIEFESQIKGGVISKPFIASVEKGVREELQNGGPLGYPVTDVRVTLTDGKMHTVDSKDIAFQMAGRNAVKAALEKGKTKLLQPMDKVTFLVDEKLQGEVSSIVARHDGYVSTVNPSADRPDLTEIDAILPTATIAQVSDALRAESAGEGQYTSVFSHYQPVPDNAMKDVAAGALHP
jgi:translation elongation factor EF-G